MKLPSERLKNASLNHPEFGKSTVLEQDSPMQNVEIKDADKTEKSSPACRWFATMLKPEKKKKKKNKEVQLKAPFDFGEEAHRHYIQTVRLSSKRVKNKMAFYRWLIKLNDCETSFCRGSSRLSTIILYQTLSCTR